MPSNRPAQALITALYEYLLITVPVGLYLTLEASHRHQWSWLWRAPEWAVATTFLLFQGLSLYVRHLRSSGATLSSTTVGLLALVSLIIMVLTLVNAYPALAEENNDVSSIAFRLGLFGIVSFGFLALVAGAKLYQLNRGGAENE